MELAGVTSSDADFLGSHEAVRKIAAAIHGTVKDEGPRVPTRATVRFVDGKGHERIIDFLRSVYGLDEKRVRDTAVTVEILDTSGAPTGVELKIMHPVVCLESRVHNVHDLEKYRTPRGIQQLQAAVGCARAYITECCESGHTKRAHRAIKVVEDLACGDAGRGVYATHQVDLLDAIPSDSRLGDAFFRENLPRIRRRAGRES